MKIRTILLLLLSPICLCACASIVNGTHEDITVETKTPNAHCKLSNKEGTWYVKNTPETVKVHRSSSMLKVECEKNGRIIGRKSIAATLQPTTLGNIIMGGAIGVAIDYTNGSAYAYPEEITV